MGTRLITDPDLIERALRVSGEPTRSVGVNKALQEFVARRDTTRLSDLAGALEWDSSYDYKAGRHREKTPRLPVRSRNG